MSVSAKNRIVFTLIALVAIVNLLFVPVISYLGGIFPGDEKLNYFDIMKRFFEEFKAITDSFYNIPIILSVACLVLLITALIGKKSHIVGSIIAILLWFVPVVQCFIYGADFDDLFNFDRGVLAIGMYVELLLFIVSLIVAAVSKSKKAEQPKFNPYGAPGYVPPYGAPQQPYGQPYGQPAQPYQAPYQPPVQNPYQQPYQAPYQAPVQPAPEAPAPQPEAPAPQPEAPAPQPEAPATAEASAKFCPACGAPAEDGPFCGNCGAKL